MRETYKARSKEFKNGKIKIREYKHINYVPKPKNSNSESGSGNKHREIGTIEKRSLSRTRNNLVELIENNDDVFNSFITLTFKKNIENIDEAYKCLQSYLKSCRRALNKEKKELFYLAVPEIQFKRAKKTGYFVIHFHLITNIQVGSSLIPEQKPKKIKGAGYKGTKKIKYYDLKYWKKNGFSVALPIQRTENFQLSKYLIKYLYKDLDDRFYGRQKILHSNNLKVPDYIYYSSEEEIEEFKNKNKENIKEVFRLTDTENPFIESIYKK